MMGDRTKDAQFLCVLKFHKFMRCNEKSPVKLTEANWSDGSIANYVCFEELEEMFQFCHIYHFKMLFELYYYRVYNNYLKPTSQQRMMKAPNKFHIPEKAIKQYY
jgi:hypothetical protein